ncbi:MAG: ABC transporter permease subunit [Acholeplasma sp.]|nr:ABC transporter permease subunit [Acholeplasma sp.]
MSKKNKEILIKILIHGFFILFAFITLIPILYAVSVSFNGSNSIVSSDFSFIPKNLTFNNYLKVFKEEPLLTWASNTLILAIVTLLVSLSVGIPAAYAFSRKRFKGSKSLQKSLILLNAFPSILSMFAIWYLMSGPIPLVNTHIGLILIYSGTMGIFTIINLKGYFDTIPVALEEAARIDGANEFQIVLKILLPLSRPAIIVTGMMIVIFVWNEYIFSSTFMTGEENYTLAGGLYGLQAGEMSGSWPVFAAASIIISIPVLIIFLKVQKYMTSGLTVGGVKE